MGLRDTSEGISFVAVFVCGRYSGLTPGLCLELTPGRALKSLWYSGLNPCKTHSLISGLTASLFQVKSEAILLKGRTENAGRWGEKRPHIHLCGQQALAFRALVASHKKNQYGLLHLCIDLCMYLYSACSRKDRGDLQGTHKNSRIKTKSEAENIFKYR